MIEQVLEDFIENGIAQMKESLENLFNELMVSERENFIGAAPYERSSRRRDYANGFKDKKLLTRTGQLNLKIPQVRHGEFYPACLEKGEGTEQALKIALAEAYLQGVSTRKMKHLTRELCGEEISAAQVSRFSKRLDEEVKKFKERKLGNYRYLYLDAQYEKVRYEGCVRSLAVLKAVGVTEEGMREILDVSCSLSEADTHWRGFIEGLVKRGMKGLKLVISDDHSGLRKALMMLLPSVKWQRCLFHLAKNAADYVPARHLKKEMAAAVREIYRAVDREEALARKDKLVERYRDKATRFCDWLEENFEEGLTFFDFPKEHWSRIRTNNLMERLNQEQKRRTRQVRLFPNIESCERLVGMIAIRMNDEWATGKRYLEIKK